MATTTAPPDTLLLSRQCLHHLRQAMDRDGEARGAGWLQEAGSAGGEALYGAFTEWLGSRFGVNRPSTLDVRHLGEVLSGFFQAQGWGGLQVSPIARAVIALDSGDWWEADPASGSPYPSCHLSSGLLAEFLSRVSETTLGTMEVECRSRGEAKCRFLAGAPETLHIVYDRMAAGTPYLEALGASG